MAYSGVMAAVPGARNHFRAFSRDFSDDEGRREEDEYFNGEKGSTEPRRKPFIPRTSIMPVPKASGL